LENLGVDSRVMLKWIFKKQIVWSWTELFWLRIWTGGRSYEHGDESSVAMRVAEFLHEMTN